MKTIFPATLLCDFYKVSHRDQYPKGTEVVYSTWTPRESRIDGVNEVVAFGFQGFIKKYLINYFDKHFFDRPRRVVRDEYTRYLKYTLGIEEPNADHIMALYDLGYLPIRIKAVPEGTLVPIRVPMLTIENTNPVGDIFFFWLTNYLETLMSCSLWQPATSATLAHEYRRILDSYAIETFGNTSAVQFQAHDFSMRGMGGVESAAASGAGHLLSFVGTDTIPAICYLEEYYNADVTKELVGTSIPATEHSVMCAHGQNELESYRYLINEVYQKGFVSIVSDTWDLWAVLEDIIPALKKDILARDGRVVIRPDSGDPVKIICGDPEAQNTLAQKGVVEVLWDIFGGTMSEKGYKVLDSHIGAIYGDAITLERCREICERLKQKGFASVNMVYGVGSFTFQFVTRDTFGFALKSTYVEINGEGRNIFKDPATDKNSVKKSQRGRVVVYESLEEGIVYMDNMTNEDLRGFSKENLLRTIFENGLLVVDESLSTIRNRLAS